MLKNIYSNNNTTAEISVSYVRLYQPFTEYLSDTTGTIDY